MLYCIQENNELFVVDSMKIESAYHIYYVEVSQLVIGNKFHRQKCVIHYKYLLVYCEFIYNSRLGRTTVSELCA